MIRRFIGLCFGFLVCVCGSIAIASVWGYSILCSFLPVEEILPRWVDSIMVTVSICGGLAMYFLWYLWVTAVKELKADSKKVSKYLEKED